MSTPGLYVIIYYQKINGKKNPYVDNPSFITFNAAVISCNDR